MEKYGRWKNVVKERVSGWISIKQKVCTYHLGRKEVFSKWILVVTVVSGLTVILFSVTNIRGGFFVVVLMCFCSWVHFHVRMSLTAEHVFGHNHLVEKKLQFMGGEDVLEEVEKFCYLVIWLVVMAEHLRQWVQELVVRGRSSTMKKEEGKTRRVNQVDQGNSA